MIARIQPALLHGNVTAPLSKSEAHRALICAALCDEPTSVFLRGASDNIETLAAESVSIRLRGASDDTEAPATEPASILLHCASEDIEATLRGLTALGAGITRDSDVLTVEPIRRPADGCAIDVGESGTTLRFLLPLAGALGCKARFFLRGRLPERPIAPLLDALRAGGCAVEQPAPNEIFISGKLHSGEYELPGNVSSQFVSGMLIALSVLNGESRLRIVGAPESAGYIRMTLKTLADFGASVSASADGYRVCGRSRLISPKNVKIGGDWSAAAFWLCASRLSSEIDCKSAQTDNLIDVRGLDPKSAQPDNIIIEEILRRMPSVFDASANPDLVPPLTALYAALGRELRVTHAGRLRLKESDRLAALAEMVCALGGHAEASNDELHIFGKTPQDGGISQGSGMPQKGGIPQSDRMPQIGEKTLVGGVPQGNHLPLVGGIVNPRGDHRIAMAAAIAAIRCANPVEILDAECVGKSYPDFWGEYARLSGRVEFLSEG